VSWRRGVGGAAILLAAVTASAAARERPPDPIVKLQWHLSEIQAPAAWEISRGRHAVVAVLDTGVAYEDRGPYRRAPDLAGTRFVAGWDFVDGDAHPDDEPPADGRRSHGTQIATIIAARAGNGIGGSGVAPEADLMPIRVLEPDLSGSSRAIADGLRFAADHGADVANVSIAGPSPSRVLSRAIGYAVARGVTIVAAAGNDGRASVSWPAADSRVVAVGSVDRGRRRASYSNYGETLDVVAPGGAGDGYDGGFGSSDGVMSQTLKGGPHTVCFCFTASTSAAAAQVSGVAALLSSSRRATSPAGIRALLRSSARDLGPAGWDPATGAGLVQARSALDAAAPGASGAASRSDGDRTQRPGWLVIGLAGGALVGATALFVVRRGRRSSR
jgi:serine protease